MTIAEEARQQLERETRLKHIQAAKELIAQIDKLEEQVKSDTKRLESLKAQLKRYESE